MDTDTIVLIILTFTAFCWFLSIRINEDRQYAKDCAKKEQDALARAERVKTLHNRQ